MLDVAAVYAGFGLWESSICSTWFVYGDRIVKGCIHYNVETACICFTNRDDVSYTLGVVPNCAISFHVTDLVGGNDSTIAGDGKVLVVWGWPDVADELRVGDDATAGACVTNQ